MVAAILEWVFIFPLIYILSMYPLSFLSLEFKIFSPESIIKVHNLMTILKQRYILNFLEEFYVEPLNLILYFLPNRIKVNVKYIFPIKIEEKGTLILPLPEYSNFRLIDSNGRPIDLCICNNTSLNAVFLGVNETGFICINYKNKLFFDANGNLIPFQIKDSKTCLYTNTDIIIAINASFPVVFVFNNTTFKEATYSIINVTRLNWVKIYTNYTGLAYLVLGEGENYTYCNCNNLKRAKYFLPIELLRLKTLEKVSGEKTLIIPIKYKDFYILVEVLR